MPIRKNSALFFFVRIQFNLVGQCTAHYGFRREWLSTANRGWNNPSESIVWHQSREGLAGPANRPRQVNPAPARAARDTKD